MRGKYADSDFIMSAPEGSERQHFRQSVQDHSVAEQVGLNAEHLTLDSMCISKHQADTNSAAGGAEPAWRG